MPNICLLAAWDKKYQELAALTWPNKVEYCKANGYTARNLQVEQGDFWLKVEALTKTLPEFDWVVWADSDLLIMDMTKKLEDFMDQDHDLIFSYDINGINVGFMFWKNTAWARCLLCQWAEDGPRFKDFVCPEQTALAYFLYREPQHKWKVVSQKQFNAYDYGLAELHWPEGQYEPGDFVIHFAGLEWPRRLDCVKDYLRLVKRPAGTAS